MKNSKECQRVNSLFTAFTVSDCCGCAIQMVENNKGKAKKKKKKVLIGHRLVKHTLHNVVTQDDKGLVKLLVSTYV